MYARKSLVNLVNAMFNSTIYIISKEDNSKNHNNLIFEVVSNNHKRRKIEI